MKEKKNLPSLFFSRPALLWGKKYMPRLLEPPFVVVEGYAGGGEVSQWPKRRTMSVDRLLGLFFCPVRGPL
jgi:hypothetical protein